MGVDCDAVSGYGIEVTEEIVDKLVGSGRFTREELDEDKETCLSELGFSYGVSGSYYTGETTCYLFASGNTLPALIEGGKELVSKLADIGILITLDDIKEVSEVLWS